MTDPFYGAATNVPEPPATSGPEAAPPPPEAGPAPVQETPGPAPLSSDERAELERLRAEHEQRTAAAAPPPSGGFANPAGTPTGAAVGTVPTGVAPPNRPALDEDGRYVAQPGDSLPLIAERFGHPGEWRNLHYHNFHDLFDPNFVAPGARLKVPPEWVEG